MSGIRPDIAKKFGCDHYDDDLGCNHPKTRAMRDFLKSIHAIGQKYVDTQAWTPDIVRRYEQAKSELPDGTDGCNLPTPESIVSRLMIFPAVILYVKTGNVPVKATMMNSKPETPEDSL